MSVPLPVIPPFREFEAWLWSLPDGHRFDPLGGEWSCGCPVATFLRERNDGGVVRVGVSRARFEGAPAGAYLPADYYLVVWRVDRRGAVTKADVLACL